jgi:hypothetical protein
MENFAAKKKGTGAGAVYGKVGGGVGLFVEGGNSSFHPHEEILFR